jgi:hypothetical protein
MQTKEVQAAPCQRQRESIAARRHTLASLTPDLERHFIRLHSLSLDCLDCDSTYSCAVMPAKNGQKRVPPRLCEPGELVLPIFCT